MRYCRHSASSVTEGTDTLNNGGIPSAMPVCVTSIKSETSACPKHIWGSRRGVQKGGPRFGATPQSQLHGVVSKPKSFDLVKLLCLPSPFQNTPHAHKYHTYIPVGSLKILPLHLPTVCIGTQTQLFHFKQTSPLVLEMMHHTPSRNKDGFAMTPPPSFTNAQRPSSVRKILSNYKLLHDPCRETATFDVG